VGREGGGGSLGSRTREVGIEAELPGNRRAGDVEVSLSRRLEDADRAEESKECPAGGELCQLWQLKLAAAAVYRLVR
jgi:hypothetical protein